MKIKEPLRIAGSLVGCIGLIALVIILTYGPALLVTLIAAKLLGL